MPERRFSATIRALREGGVDFILVGGVAAVLGGAPISTFDIDIVHSRESTNISRLLTALESLEAVSRFQPERRLKPHATYLTRYGPLDVLGSVGQNLVYEDLLPHSRELDIGGGMQVRVLDLETLIAIKESIGGEKDRAVLPILRRTLEEKLKAGQ